MSISVDLARRILEVAKQRARELRSPVSIAIVDASGHLVLFERMMAPYGWATGNISIAKANTSVMFNQSTDAVGRWASAIPGFAASLSTMTDGKFIMAAGGWPIRVDNITIGGIGVSGGNAPGRDDDIARAGLSVVAPAPQPMQPFVPMPQPMQPVMPMPQPVPAGVPVSPYTPPQVLADQAASEATPSYNSDSGEYPDSVPMPESNLHSDSTENKADTNYLSNEENTQHASPAEPSSSDAEHEERSGDQP